MYWPRFWISLLICCTYLFLPVLMILWIAGLFCLASSLPLLSALSEVYYILLVCYWLLTCMFWVHLSSDSQLKLGCFMAVPSFLGPAMLHGLSAMATAIACIAALVAYATDLAIVSFAITYSFAILICSLNFLFLCLPKWDFYYWHHVAYLA